MVDVGVGEAVVAGEDHAPFHDPVGIGEAGPGLTVGDALEDGLTQE